MWLQLVMFHLILEYFITSKIKKNGPVRDLNPGPLVPKASIIPLDQRAIDLLRLWLIVITTF